MITISLCMILKDEECVIKRCLDSIYEFVDEIIIVDTGSSDKTKDIVKNYTQNIYDFEWKDDFSAARNYSFSKATKEYVLWLDADEVIDYENQIKLVSLKRSLDRCIDVVSMQTYMCIDENNNPKIRSRRNRMIKKNNNYKWIGFLHEYIDIDAEAEVYDSDISIIHDKIKSVDDRNLQIYIKNISRGNKLSDRDIYYYGKELYYNGMYDEAIEMLDLFVNKDVWKEEIVDALCKISECYLCKKEWSKSRKYLYKTFEYIEPRGEVLYNIASSFEEEKKYEQAINWYEIILKLPLPSDCYQCVNLGCWRFKPHLNLCYCYFEIDDLVKSYYHHKKCKEINPLDKYVIANNKYFDSIIIE